MCLLDSGRIITFNSKDSESPSLIPAPYYDIFRVVFSKRVLRLKYNIWKIRSNICDIYTCTVENILGEWIFDSSFFLNVFQCFLLHFRPVLGLKCRLFQRRVISRWLVSCYIFEFNSLSVSHKFKLLFWTLFTTYIEKPFDAFCRRRLLKTFWRSKILLINCVSYFNTIFFNSLNEWINIFKGTSGK